MYTKKGSPFSCNFLCPDGLTETKEVLFPVCDVQSVADAAEINLSVKHMKTIVSVDELAAAATVNVAVEAQVSPGAELVLKVKSDGTARDVTLGTGFTGGVIAGTISKTKVATFIYDGATFIHQSTVQVD